MPLIPSFADHDGTLLSTPCTSLRWQKLDDDDSIECHSSLPHCSVVSLCETDVSTKVAGGNYRCRHWSQTPQRLRKIPYTSLNNEGVLAEPETLNGRLRGTKAIARWCTQIRLSGKSLSVRPSGLGKAIICTEGFGRFPDMTRDLMIEARISQEMWVLEAPEKGVSPNKAANAIHAALPFVAVRCKNPQLLVETQKDPLLKYVTLWN